MRRLAGITDSVNLSLSKFREMVKEGKPGALQSVGSQRVGDDLGMNNNKNLSYLWMIQASYYRALV